VDLKGKSEYYTLPLAEIFQKIRVPHNKFMKLAKIAIFGPFNYKLFKNLACWGNSAAGFAFSVTKSIRFTYSAFCN